MLNWWLLGSILGLFCVWLFMSTVARRNVKNIKEIEEERQVEQTY